MKLKLRVPRPSRVVKRWWRSRGHGVHSPFAFDFILNTLRGPNPYYAFKEIDHMTRPRMLKLIFRVACRLKVTSASVDCAPHAEIVNTLYLYNPAIDFNSPAPQLVVTSTHRDPGSARECLARGGTVIVLGERRRDKAFAPFVEGMDRGMTFGCGRLLVAVGARHLPRQHFEVNFR